MLDLVRIVRWMILFVLFFVIFFETFNLVRIVRDGKPCGGEAGCGLHLPSIQVPSGCYDRGGPGNFQCRIHGVPKVSEFQNIARIANAVQCHN